ncbi:T9SS type A sorting domain-containing protein [Rhodocytophaga rosea]|uniref:T9SS type A sorting domain-containing protein n=1 Tax=Rhodocytophaga rosea TaxID=2704465 RepID=A0A6C0GE48_9BACT|nr:PA14 domain-containing protein [Rhodocytophaga rosea]QHT66187.1 T9SS type A sorting domain-containing protein [Rhodocytophaga rosea]
MKHILLNCPNDENTSFKSTFTFSIKLILFSLFFLALTHLDGYSQTPTKQWDKTIGGDANDTIKVTIAIREGGYLLAGTSFSNTGQDKTQPSRGGADYWMVKTDMQGNKLWDKRFGSPDNDFLTAAIQTTDGGYLLGGYTLSGAGGDKTEASRGGNDYWVVKTDAQGNKLWDKRFGGTDEDRLTALLQYSDGTYLLAGNSNSEQGGDKSQESKTGEDEFRNYYDPWLIKVSSSGVRLWDKTLGNYDEDGVATIVPTSDGGILLGGSELLIKYPGYEYDLENYILLKVDANGNEQWNKRFGADASDVLTTVLPTTDGGYLLGGSSRSEQLGDKSEASRGWYDYWVIKTDAQGNKQWDKTYGGNQTDWLRSIFKTPDGGYLLAGYSNSASGSEKTDAGKGLIDFWLVKINGTGVKQWDKTFGGTGTDLFSSLLQTADNGYLLSGYSNSATSGDKTSASKGGFDFWLLKTMGTIAEPVTCVTSGTILREFWSNVAGKTVANIPVSTTPTSSSQLTSFEGPTNAGDNYGQRIRGYLCAPASGTYTFYIAADESAELWLSTDINSLNKLKIASVPSFTGVREWSKYPSQKSVAISLVAGKKYYIEALHKEELNGDNVAVGWQQPGQTAITVIPGNVLSPVIPPYIEIATPIQNTTFAPGSTITFTVNAADIDGSIQKVEFFNGNTLIGQDVTYPYSITFPAPTVGTYTLLAKATDNTNTISASLPVTIHVSENISGKKQWDKTYGGNSYEQFGTIIPTSDGGYLMGGSSSSGMSGDKTAPNRGGVNSGGDYWIIKTDANGNKLWDKTYGGIYGDDLTSIVQTSDGGYLLGGSSGSPVSGDKTAPNIKDSDFWIVKIDKNGNKLWDKTYGGTSYDNLSSVLPTNDGGFLLGGSRWFVDNNDPLSSGDPDYWIIKINADGVEQWNKRYGGDNYGYFRNELSAMIPTADGGYLLGGYSDSKKGGQKTEDRRGYDDYWVVKIDANGNKLWDKTVGGSSTDRLYDLVQASDGGYLLAGSSYSGANGDKTEPNRNTSGNGEIELSDYWLVKLNKNGIKEWDRTYGGNAYDDLKAVVTDSEDNFLLGGSSSSGISGEHTEMSRGNSDFWLVKIDKTGKIVWDKSYGNTGYEYGSFLLPAIGGGYILGGNSDSNAGNEKSEDSRGVSDYWIVKTFAETSPITCSASGSILQEKWLNITGSSVSAIPVTTSPSSSSQLTSFETTPNQGDNYGERIRGYLCVPATGSYTFYIAGDDKCELWLSTDDDPAKKAKIASVPYFTGVKVWNKYAEQKSVAITLVAGKKYYIEALHKEATGGDNLSVGWQTSSIAAITVIPGSVLSPYVPQLTGKITREFWANLTGYQISNIPLTTPATTTDQITIFERATNQGDNYGERFRGYLHPQVSGNYRFFVAGDDKAELWLSTDEDPSKKTKIASVTAYTALRQWDKYASQQSVVIALVAGRKYYIEALHKENTGNDHISVGWQLPNQSTIAVIAGTYLSPFLTSPTSSIARVGVEESFESKVSLYPNPFEDKLILSTQQAGKHYITIIDNLGRIVYQSSTHVTGVETTFDLNHLKAGVYVVKVSTEEGKIQVSRVVKK